MPPETSDREIFADLLGKERQGKKEKGVKIEKKKENCKREGGKLKMEGGKVTKWGEDPFFFACHFLKPLKFVLGLSKWKFSTGKNIRKNDFAPSEKFSCYTPVHTYALTVIHSTYICAECCCCLVAPPPTHDVCCDGCCLEGLFCRLRLVKSKCSPRGGCCLCEPFPVTPGGLP